MLGRTIKPKAVPLTGKATDQATPLHGPIQNVRFTLYNGGIYPRQLHAKPGNVLIGVEDRTGNSFSLVVQHQAGNATVLVGQVKPGSNRLRGQAQFSLGVGRYIGFDAGRPNNQAELLVQP